MIEVIRNREILASLEDVRRQYLVGDLKLPQTIDAIYSKELEVGITSYKLMESESPHRHSEATEYQYVLSGWTSYLDVDSGEEFEYVAGDFYVIHPGTSYAQKSKPGTCILFIKVPSINDKESLQASEVTKRWMETPLRTVRMDYSYDPEAPKPNSIKPAAAVAIVRDGTVLMIRRSDSGMWTLPGGTQDFGESLPECAVREIQEETSLGVTITDILGTYTDPHVCISYSDGEVRQEFTVVYIGKTDDVNVEIDDESSAYRWAQIDQLNELDIASSQKVRLNDLVTYLETGERRIG